MALYVTLFLSLFSQRRGEEPVWGEALKLYRIAFGDNLKSMSLLARLPMSEHIEAAPPPLERDPTYTEPCLGFPSGLSPWFG